MAAIRNERKEDFRTVEELTKKAFWNVNFRDVTNITLFTS